MIPKLEALNEPPLYEIKEAFQSCDSSKVIRYDSFNMKFIKRRWHEIEYDFAKRNFDFFDNGLFPIEDKHDMGGVDSQD